MGLGRPFGKKEKLNINLGKKAGTEEINDAQEGKVIKALFVQHLCHRTRTPVGVEVRGVGAPMGHRTVPGTGGPGEGSLKFKPSNHYIHNIYRIYISYIYYGRYALSSTWKQSFLK